MTSLNLSNKFHARSFQKKKEKKEKEKKGEEQKKGKKDRVKNTIQNKTYTFIAEQSITKKKYI
jgi:hypothetical protein